MVIKPTSPVEALVAFTITFSLGGLTVIIANQYGKWMCRKEQAEKRNTVTIGQHRAN